MFTRSDSECSLCSASVLRNASHKYQPRPITLHHHHTSFCSQQRNNNYQNVETQLFKSPSPSAAEKDERTQKMHLHDRKDALREAYYDTQPFILCCSNIYSENIWVLYLLNSRPRLQQCSSAGVCPPDEGPADHPARLNSHIYDSASIRKCLEYNGKEFWNMLVVKLEVRSQIHGASHFVASLHLNIQLTRRLRSSSP